VSTIWSKSFWKVAATRGIKTVAQTAIGILTTGPLIGLFEVDWVGVSSASLLSGLIAILMSIASSDDVE